MKKVDKLKEGRISRGLFAAKSAMKLLPALMKGDKIRPEEILLSLVGKNVESFVDEVGELKGSLLKAAQLLSMYGEYYLPEEINIIIKKVQAQNHFLAWEKISNHIPKELKPLLDIEQSPLAAASIGQVHKAKIKANNEVIVLKIKYPGVEKAIDVDMLIIKGIFSVGKILPKKMDMSGIYDEIRRVLLHEMDYKQEVIQHQSYKEMIGDLKGFYVPKLYPEFCSENVIVSEFINGIPLSDVEKLNLTQDERNYLGRQFYYLFYQEVFRGNIIQTDCHAGNYLIRRIGKEIEIVLIDFGACLTYDQKTIHRYRSIVSAVYKKDKKSFFQLLSLATSDVGSGFVYDESMLWDYCMLVSGPMHETNFHWGNSDLANELYPKGVALARSVHIDRPPHEFIFIDRKLLGLFSVLKLLKAQFDVKAIMDEFIN